MLFPHLGSERSAECRTRPQYELRSYREAGSSRWPGRDADIWEVIDQSIREVRM